MTKTEKLLTWLNIPKYYRGYRRLAYILELALEDEGRMDAITKELYMAASEKFNCHWTAVEHSSRTALYVAWKRKPERLEQIMGYRLFCQPSVSEFLSAAIAYLQQNPVPTL